MSDSYEATGIDPLSDDSDPDFESSSGSESDDDVSSDSSSDSGSDTSHGDTARHWREIDTTQIHPAAPRFPFTGNPEIHIQIDNPEDILPIFEAYFDISVIEIIVKETNRYAVQCLNTGPDVSNNSRTLDWHPTTNNEVKILLAIFILQSIIQKPREWWYWSQKPLLATPIFPQLMAYRRYVLLKKYLHFMDNDAYDHDSHPNPKLRKIWPIFHQLNRTFRNACTPTRDIIIDESLMLFKGRPGWARFGFKSYMLCEANNGYVYSLIIYTGKGTSLDPQYEALPLTAQIVLSLMDPLLGKGYTLTTDNYYTSPELADYLIQMKTDIYGSVRPDRKEMPYALKAKKLKPGEVVAFQRGKVMAMKWKDKKDVCLLSTIHNADMVTVTKRDGEGKKRPKVIVDYNDRMGGVDGVDQQLAHHPTRQKRARKYYRNIFQHLLELSVWNAFVVYKKSGGIKQHLDFCMELVNKLVETYHVGEFSSKCSRSSTEDNPTRLTGRHFPSLLPGQPKKRKHSVRRCVVCSRKKIRKHTTYICDSCHVSLCIVPCFKTYHTEVNF